MFTSLERLFQLTSRSKLELQFMGAEKCTATVLPSCDKEEPGVEANTMSGEDLRGCVLKGRMAKEELLISYKQARNASPLGNCYRK